MESTVTKHLIPRKDELCVFDSLDGYDRFTVNINMGKRSIKVAFEGFPRAPGGSWTGMAMRDSNRKDKWFTEKSGRFSKSLADLKGVRLRVSDVPDPTTDPIQVHVTLLKKSTKSVPSSPLPESNSTPPAVCNCLARQACGAVYDFDLSLEPRQGSRVIIDNSGGFSSIGLHVTVPNGVARYEFVGSIDGEHFSTATLRSMKTNGYAAEVNESGGYIGSISCLRKFGLSCVLFNGGDGSFGKVSGRLSREVNTLEGIEVGPPSDFFLEVSRSLNTNIRSALVVGRGTTGVQERIISSTPTTFPPDKSIVAEQISIRSSSTDDITGGKGAHCVIVRGLLGDWSENEDIVQLNGTSIVKSAKKFLRVFSVKVGTTGMSQTNVGKLIVTKDDKSVVLVQINPEAGISTSGIFTVPKGYVGFINSVRFIPPATRSSLFSIYTQDNDPEGKVIYPRLIIRQYQNISSVFIDTIDIRPQLQEFSDVWVTSQTLTGTGSASAYLGTILVKK